MDEVLGWTIFGVVCVVCVTVLLLGVVFSSHLGGINNNAAHIKEISACIRIKDPSGALACVNSVLNGVS